MLSIWTKGYKDKEARKKEVLAYRTAYAELKKILEQEYRKKDSVREYGPGWEYKQIATNEYNACLDEIMKLLDIKE